MHTCESKEGRCGSGAELEVEWEEGGLGWSLRGEAAAGMEPRCFFGLADTVEAWRSVDEEG